jgi:hypothetical protein
VNDPSPGSKIAAPEAGAFFAKKNCEIVVRPTPQAIRAFNEGMERKLTSSTLPADGLLRRYGMSMRPMGGDRSAMGSGPRYL